MYCKSYSGIQNNTLLPLSCSCSCYLCISETEKNHPTAERIVTLILPILPVETKNEIVGFVRLQ
jgi:hypothetical protein